VGLIDRLLAKRNEAWRLALDKAYIAKCEALNDERRVLEAQRQLLQQEQAESREQFLKAISAIAEHFALGQKASAEQVGMLAMAAKSQADAFASHIALFQTTAPTKSRVIRDIDEYNAELLRDPQVLATDFPEDGSPEDQLKWVLANS
jgi:hypothetical protein